jgi:hypothetical protein
MATSAGPDRHQIAGLDERERGFSRQVDIEPAGQSYRAVLRYEGLVIATEAHGSQEGALEALIQELQRRGYRQIKTQMSFREGLYLGSNELWIEYPDRPAEPAGWLAKFRGWFRPPSL